MRRSSWLTILLVIVVGSAVGIGVGSYLAWLIPAMRHTQTPVSALLSNPFGDQRYVRLLMVGEDDTHKGTRHANGLSDTLVVFAIDTQTRDIRGISIPRDTRVRIPGHGVCKINAAHSYGGPELTRQVVTHLLGVNLDYYVKVNTTGLREMVDLVGGVYVEVEKNMYYRDRRGGLLINLKAKPGKQLLNGQQAEGYVRFRHDTFGDYGWETIDGEKHARGRVVRQQYFFRALANRILAMPTKRQRADFLRQCYENKYIVSDLNLMDWQGMADLLKDIQPDNIAMDVMPGQVGDGYVIPDRQKLNEVVTRNLRFQGTVGEQMAKVEVLNGSGVGGAAGRVARRLEAAGFDVTRTDNATSFDYNRCRIITRNPDDDDVRRVANMLDGQVIEEESAGDDQIDVTVIVGRDYED